MQRIDAYYLYQFGHKLHRITEINVEYYEGQDGAVTKKNSIFPLKEAERALREFLHHSIFDMKIARSPGDHLLLQISNVVKICEGYSSDDEKLKFYDFSSTAAAAREFEAVLKAELGRSGIFLVAPKNAMDTLLLIEAGEQAFPLDLHSKVPSAIDDVKQAMSCIAFELPTAAAFHLHRANETVLKSYWDAVSNGEKISKNATMGQIVKNMEDKDFGREEIRSSLRDIIRLHRNPTIHPEQKLNDVEEAINLYGAIRSIVGFMLREIPIVTPDLPEPYLGEA